MRKVMRQSQLDRPKETASSPRFKFFCSDNESLKALKDACRAFVAYYRQCLKQFCQAIRIRRTGKPPLIEWPEGSYPPSVHRPMGRCFEMRVIARGIGPEGYSSPSLR